MLRMKLAVPTIAGLVLAITLTLGPAVHAEPPSETPPARTSDDYLAHELIQRALFILDAKPMTVEALVVAKLLVDEAVTLSPDDREICRIEYDLAMLAEDTKGAQTALARLVRLDPDDDAARLRWVTLSLDRYQSAQERIAAYRQMLADAGLTPEIRSRLWLDLALLHKRRGEREAFTDALAEAVALDPSNRSAAGIAAGFFRVNVDDPYAEAELLLGLLAADPTDVTTRTTLAELLLRNGAYVGAARMYRVVLDSMELLETSPPSDLLADNAIAMWASGQTATALDLIEDRQEMLEQQFMLYLRMNESGLDARERAIMAQAPESAPIAPLLATVRLAILDLLGRPEASNAMERAMVSYDATAELWAESGVSSEQIARLRLEKVFVAAWFGAAADVVRSSIETIEETHPLTAEARQRFDGIVAMRAGDLDRALELLEPLAEHDDLARVGYGEALIQKGRRRDGARALLVAARAQPGTLSGVWASERLSQVLEQRLPTSDLAQRLEALIKTLPRVTDRFIRDATLAVSLRVRPAKATFEPFEPVIVYVDISNNSGFPLAIDRDGPIRPQVLLELKTAYDRSDKKNTVPYIIADIGRRLVLPAGERLSVPVVLTWHKYGQSAKARVLDGDFVSVNGMMNFRADRRGAFTPGLLGSKSSTGTMRIEGVRPTADWEAETLALLANPEGVTALQRIALLSQLRAKLLVQISADRAERRALRARLDVEARERGAALEQTIAANQIRLNTFTDTIVGGYTKMDGRSQAWVVSMVPTEVMPEAVMQMARKSEDRWVQIVFILTKVEDPDDPMVDAGRRSPDIAVRAIANAASVVLRAQPTPIVPGAGSSLPPPAAPPR